MISFLKFVADQPPHRRDVHCAAMVYLFYFDHINYHDIIRYETFENDIRRLMEKLNVIEFPIPQPGKARTDAGSHVHEVLGEEECALIRTIYDRDFEAFGYSRDLSDLHRLS